MIHSRTDRDDQLKYISYTMYVHVCITSGLDFILFIVFNATSSNISAISWQVLVVEEA